MHKLYQATKRPAVELHSQGARIHQTVVQVENLGDEHLDTKHRENRKIV